MRIHFRSRYSTSLHSGQSFRKNYNSGSDWSGIQGYTQGDARHIIWKKSTFNTIIEKTFEENKQISAIFFHHVQIGDTFSIKNTMTKQDWKESNIKLLINNAQKAKIPFQKHKNKDIEKFFDILIQKQIRHQLIIILSSIDPRIIKEEKLKKVSSINEIIWIFPIHPFEKNPNNETLIQGKIISEKSYKSYQEDFQNYQYAIKQYLRQYNISFLPNEISTPIDIILHYFFKNEYK